MFASPPVDYPNLYFLFFNHSLMCLCFHVLSGVFSVCAGAEVPQCGHRSQWRNKWKATCKASFCSRCSLVLCMRPFHVRPFHVRWGTHTKTVLLTTQGWEHREQGQEWGQEWGVHWVSLMTWWTCGRGQCSFHWTDIFHQWESHPEAMLPEKVVFSSSHQCWNVRLKHVCMCVWVCLLMLCSAHGDKKRV